MNEQERTPHLQNLLNELMDFRKLMLVYRLIHFEDQLTDIDVGVTNRNKQLCKPYIRLFYGYESQIEVEQTFQEFLNIKNDRKCTSVEAILLPFLLDLIKQKGTNDLYSNEIWKSINENIQGELVNPNEYHIGDYRIYKNTIVRDIFVDKFGGEYRHTNSGGKVLYDKEKLEKLQKSYNTGIIIRTTPKSDGCDSCDGSQENGSTSNDGLDIVSDNNIQENFVNITRNDNNNEDIPQKEGLEDSERPPSLSQHPSHPSLSEEDIEKANAQARTKYDVTRARINREFKWI
jgi:hypothetical protein